MRGEGGSEGGGSEGGQQHSTTNSATRTCSLLCTCDVLSLDVHVCTVLVLLDMHFQ